MQIKKLENRPVEIEAVAKMIYGEFVEKTQSKATMEDIVFYLSHPNEKQFPYSLVALEGEKYIGTVSIFEQDIKERSHYTPCLASLYVEQDYRKNGIGTQLINEVTKIVRNLGYKEIFLKTETARKFYERIGWTYLETMTDEFGEDSYLFKLSL